MAESRTRSVPTPVGTARLHVDGPEPASALLVLGHGAGGGVEAPDLQAARDAAVALGWSVVRVEQPWRVRGRRVAEAAPRLDQAWLAAVAALAPAPLLVLGGRSSGARVACRTAEALGAAGVLLLAFPLVPPGRPDRSRAGELALPAVPRLVVQGSRDAFGVPEPAPGVRVEIVEGADHAFAVRRADGRTRADVLAQLGAAVTDWLEPFRR